MKTAESTWRVYQWDADPLVCRKFESILCQGNGYLGVRAATEEDGEKTVRYALVAGFVEIGETFEDTVKREVMEEVGLPVKNVRYHASQPWGFAGNIMVGFWADLDSDDETVTLDEAELDEGVWLTREEIPAESNPPSLTHTMIQLFREGKDPQ